MPSRNATLIAYYDTKKPNGLATYVVDLQQLLAASIPTFVAKPISDVHATIIGLESYGPLASGDEEAELARLGGEGGLRKLCKSFAEAVDGNVVVQFGGFSDRDYSISSRNRRLFERTLSAHRGQLMLLGWPVTEESEPTDFLDGLRRGAQQYGVSHRYHQSPTDQDPDAYMVIGTVSELTDQDAGEIDRLRHLLATWSCQVRLDVDSLQVATYEDTNLPRPSTRTWPLATFLTRAEGDAK